MIVAVALDSVQLIGLILLGFCVGYIVADVLR